MIGRLSQVAVTVEMKREKTRWSKPGGYTLQRMDHSVVLVYSYGAEKTKDLQRKKDGMGSAISNLPLS